VSDAVKRVLIVGAGGLGSPAALVLAKSAVALTILDDDVVDASNLHRQLLFDAGDVGRSKVERAEERLRREGATVRTIEGRLLPSNAIELARDHDLVVEGADNFATKFLAADACALAGVPIVQAGAVRWSGWALSGCLRCVFEDLPRDRVETCAEAGVVGPVVGVLGAISAGLALSALRGDRGQLVHYDALAGKIRARRVNKRPGCALCEGAIGELRMERYAPACD
jgi:molybdopterin/thiamine biosynthesis adenylyltransferase